MYILGISCFYHDAAACLVKDGLLICAAEEERFSRKKHDFGFPEQSINFCLEFANISARELDYIVFYEKPFKKFERILKTIIATYPLSGNVFAESVKNWLLEKLWIKNIIKECVGIPEEKIFFVEHHLAHAASAFLVSPFKEAAILTIDGVGEWATGTLGFGKDNEITLFEQLNFPHSLGLLYSAFTAFLGFEVNEGEYKVMGMAAYGKPRFAQKIYDNLLRVFADGSFALNLDYFSYHYSTSRSYTRKFEKLFGMPRPAEKDFFTKDFSYPRYFGEKPQNYEELCEENQYYADIAASIQKVTEEIILKQANFLYEKTKKENLCLAGGVALNSVANGRLLSEGPFREIFIQPAAGDSGAAIGAAFYFYNCVLNYKRAFTLEHANLGKQYAEKSILNFLTSNNIKFAYFENTEQLIEQTVDAIIQGKVVGWFQGRFEWGPRALGNRSILADPRQAKMKDIVNLKIKFREPFRPFAPTIVEEEFQNYFEIPNAAKQYPTRFMLFVLPIKQDKEKLIPAVDHQGTGRVQTIKEEWNRRYYQLIKNFGRKTGIPIVLNTSFNLKGEPIVNSPQDAYQTFINSGLDVLVMEKFMITKELL